jgi:EAL domain-containing protein (putative c-di-GMP-specific phosphodiesterase class I)/ActR/RegA family two-component response regulator
MAGKRLLILDDDPLIGQTIQFIAEDAGFDSHFTDEPGEFFQKLQDWGPTHIALDLVMPQMDGVEVMVELSRLGVDARIIITSGVGSRVLDAARRSATEHGLDFAGALAKPFSPARLQALLTAEPDNRAHPGDGGVRSPPHRMQEKPAFRVTAEALEHALANRQLRLDYQPKIRCNTGEIAGFEALVRWHHPEAGLVMPDRFIPFAEENGYMERLTEEVLEQALGWFYRFMADSGGPTGNTGGGESLEPHVSINLSARNLKDMQFADRVAAKCQELGLETRHVIFELTETSAMEDPVISLDLLTRLRVKGFSLSIDDFGTGFSSMVQLVRLPFSELKVDKSFVINAMTSEESRTIIRSTVELGQSLGLRVTAEGVENAQTLDLLRDIGCDLAQGYHIARPMSEDALGDWLNERKS